MASINHVTLLGNVGADPVVRDIGGGNKAAQFSIATSESYKDRDGTWKERAEWHNIVAFNGYAFTVEKFVRKGSQICVEGKLRTRSWTDQQGVKRYVTEIIVSNIQLLGTPQERRDAAMVNGARALAAQAQTQAPAAAPVDNPEDDLPF